MLVLWDNTSSGCVPSKPMSSGVTTFLRLLDPEDANVDIVVVSGTSSLHPQVRDTCVNYVNELNFNFIICTQIGLKINYINV